MVGLNLALNLTLVWWLREAGLAAATALCAIIQVAVLSRLLHGRVKLEGWRRVGITAVKSLAASGIMALVCITVLGLYPAGPMSGRFGMRIARVLVPVAAGVATYAAISALLGAEEMQMFIRSMLRRGEQERPGD